MDSTGIIGGYEEMLNLTRQMLAFARNGEWDCLAALEKQRTAIVARLAKRDVGPLGAPEQAMKGELIRAILAADAEIMTRSESWLGELHGGLRSSGNEYKLKQVYGTR